ncbi:thiamine pyrophosphate-dependent enzyme [Rhodococcus sp. (in: high G+C Gram-positive bacteria)]|uniref:thiamine pyrophosphate-dependent enzyme n=1 Tax=Rhodococcus sp. TaxID=1831 RepID=UPI003B8A853C
MTDVETADGTDLVVDALESTLDNARNIIAIEGDSAFGFRGMEIETICRYRLPVVVLVFDNGGVYRGDEINPALGRSGADRAAALEPVRHADRGVRGVGYHAETSEQVAAAVRSALASGEPALVDCVIDPAVGTESGHLQKLRRPSHEEET